MLKSVAKSFNTSEEASENKEVKTKVSKKSSHLYLQDRKKCRIHEGLSFKYLTHLYLHNNQIHKIENLSDAFNLKELYLHNNRIKKIENLSNLINLRKLHLGRNEICVVEGLETLKNLEELYVEKQKLRESDSLCFDPRSIFGIRNSLTVLNICRNNMNDIADLIPLKELRTLDVSENNITNIEEACDVVSNFPFLYNLIMVGNPISKIHRYRESLINFTDNVKFLDKKPVSEVTRTFIQRMEKEIMKKKSFPQIRLSDVVPEYSKTYPEAVQKTVLRSIVQKQLKSKTDGGGDFTGTFLPPKKKNNFKKMVPNKLRQNPLVNRNVKLRNLSQNREEQIQDLFSIQKVKATKSSHT